MSNIDDLLKKAGQKTDKEEGTLKSTFLTKEEEAKSEGRITLWQAMHATLRYSIFSLGLCFILFIIFLFIEAGYIINNYIQIQLLSPEQFIIFVNFISNKIFSALGISAFTAAIGASYIANKLSK